MVPKRKSFCRGASPCGWCALRYYPVSLAAPPCLAPPPLPTTRATRRGARPWSGPRSRRGADDLRHSGPWGRAAAPSLRPGASSRRRLRRQASTHRLRADDLQPYIVAAMTEASVPGRSTGPGDRYRFRYQAAILAEIVKMSTRSRSSRAGGTAGKPAESGLQER